MRGPQIIIKNRCLELQRGQVRKGKKKEKRYEKIQKVGVIKYNTETNVNADNKRIIEMRIS